MCISPLPVHPRSWLILGSAVVFAPVSRPQAPSDLLPTSFRLQSLLSAPSSVAPSSAVSLRSREAFCSVSAASAFVSTNVALHRTSLQGPPLHGSRRSLVVREDGSWCRLRLVGSGSMLFGGDVDVSVVYTWWIGWLFDREGRSSLSVDLDGSLVACSSSLGEGSMAMMAAVMPRLH